MYMHVAVLLVCVHVCVHVCVCAHRGWVSGAQELAVPPAWSHPPPSWPLWSEQQSCRPRQVTVCCSRRARGPWSRGPWSRGRDRARTSPSSRWQWRLLLVPQSQGGARSDSDGGIWLWNPDCASQPERKWGVFAEKAS